MGIQSENGLRKAYELLAKGNPAQARQVLEDTMQFDLDNQEAKFAVWCCTFWSDCIADLSALDASERGKHLISHWKAYRQNMAQHGPVVDRAVYATEKGVFTLALESYQAQEDESDPASKAEIYRKLGFCSKKLGNYGDALTYLTDANRYSPQSAAILAEMADCYALCGEEKNAKLLFREAFFIDAEAVELAFLDSELICCLIRKVQEKGYAGAALQEWIPVYGVLYGILNVKRQLRSNEVGRLKQDIYARENEQRNATASPETLTPRLINMYFWLIDYYVRAEDGRERINEILLKIKMLDRNIYALYNVK